MGAPSYSFGDYVLDTQRYELRRGEHLVAVEPQVFDLLTYLIAHRDRVIDKRELLDEVWGTRFVTESALTSRVKAARRAVGDSGQEQWAIRPAARSRSGSATRTTVCGSHVRRSGTGHRS
jgi:DNA-binding winged helix-turn-helix (wHTH) protein